MMTNGLVTPALICVLPETPTDFPMEPLRNSAHLSSISKLPKPDVSIRVKGISCYGYSQFLPIVTDPVRSLY